MGADTGNIHQQCQTLSDKHRTDPSRYGADATTRREGSSITNAQIQAWRDLPPETKRETGGWKTWAQLQGIASGSAGNFLTNSGLTLVGTERLKPPGERSTPITNMQIQTWRDLPPETKREAGGWMKWAQLQGINIKSARTFLTNSGLTLVGTERLKPPEERGTPITNTQIQTWRDLPQEAKREAGGWMKWAQAQGVDISCASSYLTNTGLKPKGIVRLQPPGERGSPITQAQLLAWFNMSPEERHTSGGWAAWRRHRGYPTGAPESIWHWQTTKCPPVTHRDHRRPQPSQVPVHKYRHPQTLAMR
ncbi:phage-like protein [Salmonella enterica subsp. arizonae]|nr:phage-like protein [Salmonella enterica subsp. arizonae]